MDLEHMEREFDELLVSPTAKKDFWEFTYRGRGYQEELVQALVNETWLEHSLGDKYRMTNVGGKDGGVWSIAYYPLFGTYKQGKWVTHDEPRALIERPIEGGIDFREMPLRYLTRL